jgi:hypothetical protein
MSPTSYRTAPPRVTQTLALIVGLGRFELPTSRLSGVRSNQLSYRPVPLMRLFLPQKRATLSSARARLNDAQREGPCSFGGFWFQPAIYFWMCRFCKERENYSDLTDLWKLDRAYLTRPLELVLLLDSFDTLHDLVRSFLMSVSSVL